MQWLPTWAVLLEDGSIVHQYGDSPGRKEGGRKDFLDIDQQAMKEFRLLTPDGDRIYTLHWNRPQFPNRALIYREKTDMSLPQAMAGNGEYKSKIWLVGWHEKVNGVNMKSIAYISQNDEGGWDIEQDVERPNYALFDSEKQILEGG